MARNNSMAARTLSRGEQAWKYRCEGKSLRTIGDLMGIAHVSVWALLNGVYERRSVELDESVTAHKMEQVDALDAVIEEARAAWERSKENSKTDHTVTKRQKSKPANTDSDTPEPVGLYVNLYTGEETTEQERAALLATVGMDAAGNLLPTVEQTTTRTSAGQTGNPAHLGNLLAALKAKRDLLGLEAPTRQEITGAGGGAVRITEMVIERPEAAHPQKEVTI